MPTKLAIDKEAIAEFCRQYDICKLSLFDSVLRDDFDPRSSDVDVLLEFDSTANKRLSHFDLARLEFELEGVLGYCIDLSLADMNISENATSVWRARC